MKNVWTISDYELVQDIRFKHIKLVIPILLVTIGIIYILFQYEFLVYERQTLIKENNRYEMVVSSKRINNIKKRNSLLIQNQKYNYVVKEVDSNYMNWNNEIYQTIYLELPNYQTDAIMTECYFLTSKKSIFNRLLDYLKGVKV